MDRCARAAPEEAARAWIRPLLQQLNAGQAEARLHDLRALARRRRKKKRAAVEPELNYLESHQERMDYAAAWRAGKPLGSGAMKSTCRQYQC